MTMQEPVATDTEEKVIVDDPAASELENPKDSYAGRKHKPESELENPKDSYAGRKHKPEIDGPEQDSQETDEVYADPRKEENLPAGGKNAAELNAYDLSQKGNE